MTAFCMLGLLRTCRVGFAAAVLGGWFGHVVAAETWPTIALPNGVDAFKVGSQLDVNGAPMRITGFLSDTKDAATLLAWFRRSLGTPLVESAIGPKKILGRLQNGYYLTIQVEPSGQGSKGFVALTDVKGLVRNGNKQAGLGSSDAWLSRWPADTRLISRVSSNEGGRVMVQTVLSNGLGESFNKSAVLSLMKDDGFAIEQEVQPGNHGHALPFEVQEGTVMYFKGKSKEAVAVISRLPQGQTSIVLNTNTAVEEFKQ